MTNTTHPDEIRQLRREAMSAGDLAQVVVCDIALDEFDTAGGLDAYDWSGGSRLHCERVLAGLGIESLWAVSISDVDAARRDCARAIAETRGTSHSARFYPTYGIRTDLDEKTARLLAEQQGEGPLGLSDVTDVCASYRVTAELRDQAGFLVGRVDENGDYRLGSP